MTGRVRNDHYSARNNPKERSSYLLRGGSLKPRTVLVVYLLTSGPHVITNSGNTQHPGINAGWKTKQKWDNPAEVTGVSPGYLSRYSDPGGWAGDRIPVGGEIFCTCPNRFSGPPSLR